MIIVDSREPKEFRKYADKVMKLNKGDIWICKNNKIVKIERKSMVDLIKTIQEDRLNNQLDGVDELIIMDADNWLPRGIFDTLFTDGKVRRVINGISRHTPVEFCTDIEDYFNTLKLIEKHLENGTYAVLRRRAVVDRSADDPRITMIASIPGIGTEKAKLLIEKYGCIYDVIFDAYKWNEDIKGIGSKTVDDAIKFFMDKKKIGD